MARTGLSRARGVGKGRWGGPVRHPRYPRRRPHEGRDRGPPIAHGGPVEGRRRAPRASFRPGASEIGRFGPPSGSGPTVPVCSTTSARRSAARAVPAASSRRRETRRRPPPRVFGLRGEELVFLFLEDHQPVLRSQPLRVYGTGGGPGRMVRRPRFAPRPAWRFVRPSPLPPGGLVQSERETAPSKARVYGSVGCSNSESASCCSTIRPARITMTRSARLRTTPRSCVTTTNAVPELVRNSLNRSIIAA